MTKITPLPGYVLVSPIKEETQSGGIYLPEDINDKPSRGKIISISACIPFNFRDALLLEETTLTKEYKKLKVGQVILHKKWVNETVKSEGKELLFVRFEDILGIEE